MCIYIIILYIEIKYFITLYNVLSIKCRNIIMFRIEMLFIKT